MVVWVLWNGFFLELIGCIFRCNPNIYYFRFLNFYSMKRALLPITLVVILSVLIYSCSSNDDDTSTPPSVVQTPEPEPPAQNQNLIYKVEKSLVNINVANERDLVHVTELFGPMGTASSIVYQNETGTYLLAPGVVTCFNGECNNVDSALEIVPSSSYLMKKEICNWKFHVINLPNF